MSEPDSRSAHREQVYEAFADRRLPFGDAVVSALEAGTDRLGVDIGFLTRIEDGTQYVEQSVGDHPWIQPGEQCPLEEAYCQRTIQLDGHLSVQDASSSPEISDRAYEAFGLGAYIGCKIVVDEGVYGTVCFADPDPRERSFSEAEELFVELIARLAGRAIERRSYEREQTERTAQLRAEKRRFEGIAENSFDVIYRIDTDGELTYVSQAVERVLGYGPDELVGAGFETVTGYTEAQITGNNCRVLQGPGTDPDGAATLRAGIDDDRPVTTQILNYRRDGTPFWNRITVTPVEDETGTVTHYLGFQQDITEQQRVTRLVELLNRVLRHNFRNELTVIEGYTDFVGDPPEGMDVQAKIRRPLRRLVSLSERARTLEHIAKKPRDPTRLDPTALLSDVAQRHRSEYPTVTLTVDVSTDRDICAGIELEAALDELVANAVTHDPDDGTAISLDAHDDGDRVVVRVTDDGPGIPPMEVAVVDAGQETPLEHGKGLGLWLVNWVVTQYGGSFQLSAENGPVETAARRPTALLG